MKRYPDVVEGEWIHPVEQGYRMSCCDCGLVHTLDFRVEDGQVEFRAFRNNRATAQLRRHRDYPAKGGPMKKKGAKKKGC